MVTIDKKGYVNKQEFYQLAIEKIKNSSLNSFVPHDGDKYKINGTPESWAHFALRIVTVESGFDVNCTNLNDPGGSYGLFQWGIQYGITKSNWRDPEAQLDAFIAYAKVWTVQGGGFINPPSGVTAKRSGRWGGFAAVFSTIRNDKANSKYAYNVVDAITKTEKQIITPLVVEEKKKSTAAEMVKNVVTSVKKTVQKVIPPKVKPKTKPKSSNDSVGDMIRKRLMGDF